MRGALGSKSIEKDAARLRVITSTAPVPGASGDHGLLTGLGDDDHSQYVHISAARTITAQHSIAPTSPQAPWLLGANAQGQLVTGLNADLWDGVEYATHIGDSDAHHNQVHNIVGADHTVTGSAWDLIGLTATDTLGILTPSADPGGIEAILKTNGSGLLTLADMAIRASGTVNFINGGSVYTSAGTLVLEGAQNVNIVADAGSISISPATILTALVPGNVTIYSTGGTTAVYGGTALNMTSVSGATTIGASTTLTLQTSTGDLTIAPAGDIVFNPTGNDLLPSVGYDLNIGSIQKKYLTLHASELWVETLVAQDTIATIGGRILVGPTTPLTRDLAAAATTLYVKHNQMASGDRAYLEANGFVEFIAITSAPTLEGAGDYSYTCTRNLDGSGANDWYAGDAVFNTGTTGDGFIDLYSLSGVVSGSGPAIVGNIRKSATYNDWNEHWAIGNLNGVYGYASAAYGAAFGEYAAAASHITIDSTNGLRFFDGLSTVVAQWQVDGDLFIGTNIAAAGTTYLSIFNNAQTYNTESMAAGDMLIGDNSASKANILWDKSLGRLLFRGGQTTTLYLDTDGTLWAGGGSAMIDTNGLQIAADNKSTTLRWVDDLGGTNTPIFWTIADVTASTYTFYLISANAPSAAGYSDLYLWASGNAANADAYVRAHATNTDPYVTLVARDSAATVGQMTVYRNRIIVSGAYISVGSGGGLSLSGGTPGSNALYVAGESRLQQGVHIGDTTVSAYNDDLTIDGGIWVGYHADPAVGNIGYTGTLYSRKGTTNYAVYGFHPLTTRGSSTSWDGDTKTAANNGLYSISVWGVPTTAKAVAAFVITNSATAGAYLNTGSSATQIDMQVNTQVASRNSADTGIIICDGSGQIYFSFSASMSVWVYIIGYFI